METLLSLGELDLAFAETLSDLSISWADIARKPTVRVFCRVEENHSLSIRDGKVILARSNPSDEFQHWIKDEKYSTRVKHEESFPSFSLVNKVTGQALKHSVGATHPVKIQKDSEVRLKIIGTCIDATEIVFSFGHF